MAIVSGMTAERMLQIEQQSVVSGLVSEGHLILYRKDGTQIDAGVVTASSEPGGGSDVVVVRPPDIASLPLETASAPVGSFIVADPQVGSGSGSGPEVPPVADDEHGVTLGTLYYKTGNTTSTIGGGPVIHSTLLNLSGSVAIDTVSLISNVPGPLYPAGTLVYERHTMSLWLIAGWEESTDVPGTVAPMLVKLNRYPEIAAWYMSTDSASYAGWEVTCTIAQSGDHVDVSVAIEATDATVWDPETPTDTVLIPTITYFNPGAMRDPTWDRLDSTWLPDPYGHNRNPTTMTSMATLLVRRVEDGGVELNLPLTSVPIALSVLAGTETNGTVEWLGRYIMIHCDPTKVKEAFDAHGFADLTSSGPFPRLEAHFTWRTMNEYDRSAEFEPPAGLPE